MLESFIQWQKERPSRRVNIEIRDGVTIWVYDTSLMAGQYVTDVREIDLEGKREERERREFERLSAKFNGKGGKCNGLHKDPVKRAKYPVAGE